MKKEGNEGKKAARAPKESGEPAGGLDLGLIAYPVAFIILWEAAYALFDIFFPPGGGNLHLASVFFITEFAVIFVIPLYLSARLSKERGMGLGGVSKHFLAFFAAFAALGLASSVLLSALHSADLAYSLLFFAMLDLSKLAIGFAGVISGFYLQGILKPSSWDSYKASVMYVSAAVLVAALAVSYAAGAALSGSISATSSPDYSDSAANCTIGSWSTMSFFGAALNVTVQGLEAYRGRQSCHSNGTSVLFGDNVTYDFYSVTSDDYCSVVTTEAQNGTSVKESCNGEWPGYAGNQ
jgi:hypothetical protein